MKAIVWSKYQCTFCDQAKALLESKWEDLPQDFLCPECGVGKEDYETI